MCWLWLPGSGPQKKEHIFGWALTGLGRLLTERLACLAEEIAACLFCQRDVKGEERTVNMVSLWSRQVKYSPTSNTEREGEAEVSLSCSVRKGIHTFDK